jgi:nucleotidyltransferase substrate binding protein (TIGR01987 family)
MSVNKDIRWKQRYSNYQKALRKLTEGVTSYREEDMSDIEKEGLIQRFEYTYELAWNTIKDFYEEQGEVNIQGSKDAIRLAFQRGLIGDSAMWLKMVDSRKLTVHTYNEETANTVAEEIGAIYYDLFMQLEARLQLEKLQQEQQG